MNKPELFITLHGEGRRELIYRVEEIFNINDGEQLYCAAVLAQTVPGEDSEVVFFRCSLVERGDETQIDVFAIPETVEYEYVGKAYDAIVREARESVYADLAKRDDIMTVIDENDNELHFIAHFIICDDESGREYLAVQRLDDIGDPVMELEYFRLSGDGKDLEPISSDMEFDRVRELAMARFDMECEPEQ